MVPVSTVSNLLLTYYNPHFHIILAPDGTDHGIGSNWLHKIPNANQKAIGHVSCALSRTEKMYNQIEEEEEESE